MPRGDSGCLLAREDWTPAFAGDADLGCASVVHVAYPLRLARKGAQSTSPAEGGGGNSPQSLLPPPAEQGEVDRLRSKRDGGGWRGLAHGGEHALVLRDGLRPPQHEGSGAVLQDSVGFLGDVALLFGQRRIRRFRVPITERVERFHPKGRNNVSQQLDEHTQHRAQQELGERWRADLVCMCSRWCHGRHYTRAQGPVGSAGRFPTLLWISVLNSWAKIFGRPLNPDPLHPPIPATRAVILGLVPRILVGCFVATG